MDHAHLMVQKSIVMEPTIRGNALVGALVSQGKVPLIKLWAFQMPGGRAHLMVQKSIVTLPTIRANALVGTLVRKGKVPPTKL